LLHDFILPRGRTYSLPVAPLAIRIAEAPQLFISRLNANDVHHAEVLMVKWPPALASRLLAE
jgi:hypothetical protein